MSVENGCRVIPANTTSMEDALRKEAKKRKVSSLSRKGAKSAADTFLTQAGGGGFPQPPAHTRSERRPRLTNGISSKLSWFGWKTTGQSP